MRSASQRLNRHIYKAIHQNISDTTAVMEETHQSKRFRNFMIQSLSHSVIAKARTIAKYTKDDQLYYLVSMFNSCTAQYMTKLSDSDTIAVTLKDIKEYTHIEDVVYGLDSVQKEVTQYKENHEKNLQRGKLLYQVVQTEDSHVMLPQTDQQCIELYCNYIRTIESMDQVELHPWQNELLTHIDKVSDRTVIWIYIKRLYGDRRVYCGSLSSKADNICYALSKELLSFKDLFLFNIVRSDTIMKHDPYVVIEGIKDGLYFSGKYASKQLHFKTPNTVIIFANSAPDLQKLSADRWCVYQILSNLTLHKETE